MDRDSGPGVSASATEQAFDTSGNLVGTTTWSLASNSSPVVALTAGYQTLNIVLTINKSIGSTGAPSSHIDISTIDQYFGQTLVSQLSSISSNVFCDENDNGTYVPGDFGLSGVTVDLLNGAGTQVLQTTTTDANGNYSFNNLTAGTYETQVIAPAGDSITTGNNGVDSNITLAGGTDTVAPVGLYMPAIVDVNVYYDQDETGTYNATDDYYVPGMTVDLINTANNEIVQAETTDVNGNVSFTGLVPGTYEVVVLTPAGVSITQETNVGSAGEFTVASCSTVNAVEGFY